MSGVEALSTNVLSFGLESWTFHKLSHVNIEVRISLVWCWVNSSQCALPVKTESALVTSLDVKCSQCVCFSTAVACPALPAISNGKIFPQSCSSSGGKYTETCSYSCVSGYTLLGGGSRTCLADGTWDGAAPTCKKGKCIFFSWKRTAPCRRVTKGPGHTQTLCS